MPWLRAIPAMISDFQIDPQTLLTIPIKNEIPVYVESAWHREVTAGDWRAE